METWFVHKTWPLEAAKGSSNWIQKQVAPRAEIDLLLKQQLLKIELNARWNSDYLCPA